MTTTRRAQAAATRTLLLRTAERLYAERGLSEVSNRQIVDAAGLANNSALTYHIGTREDLIRALAREHGEPILARTRELTGAARGSTDPRAHVAALVSPYVEHLGSLGHPSWFARFSAQLSADPVFGRELRADPSWGPLIGSSLDFFRLRRPELRSQMVQMLVIHTCAALERQGEPVDWPGIGEELIDAVTGLLLASGGTPPDRDD